MQVSGLINKQSKVLALCRLLNSGRITVKKFNKLFNGRFQYSRAK